MVARGEKQDGEGAVVNLAIRASQPHPPPPLPPLSGIPDEPEDAVSVAVSENAGPMTGAQASYLRTSRKRPARRSIRRCPARPRRGGSISCRPRRDGRTR